MPPNPDHLMIDPPKELTTERGFVCRTGGEG